ncbi:MAG: mechanosensitive ion channel family protein [Oscillospiraceae bacterium]|nr:mechanosensitive ion channel family protein [Oscillospiraceae bacterium]
MILTSAITPSEEDVEVIKESVLNNLNVRQVIYTILLLVVCVVVIRIILLIFDRFTVRLSVEKGLRKFLHSVVNVLLWLVVAIIVLSYLGVPMTSLVAVLGIIGLAASLAVQGALSNLAGGIMVLTAKPFKADDVVEINSVSGTVVEVGLVYTKVQTADNKVIYIPNSEVSGGKITNYTVQEKRRVDFMFTLRFDAPMEQVKQVVQEAIAAHPLVLFTPEPFVRVNAYLDNGVQYVLRVWCGTADYWTVYHDLLEQVGQALRANGLGMADSRVRVQMVEEQRI